MRCPVQLIHMEDSVFTKIIKGEIPSHKVYEDERTIAIIPLHTIAKGHVLVIPKVQVDQFIDLDEADYQAVMAVVQKVGKRMKEVLNPQRIGLQVVGLDVPHVHVHVIAFDTLAQFRELPDESAAIDHAKHAEMVQKLAF
ncbi:MAG: putative Histidine triad protein [Candidatus Saccharibacteria bacterium]|nr:putative Histidine triad protein [Candidatus Saccharibacteria bacterium]